MEFVTTRQVLDEAIARGMAGREETWAYASYLDAVDRALDGKADGGFFKGQVTADGYFTVVHPFAADAARAQRVNRLVSSLLASEAPAPRAKRAGGSLLEEGAKVLLAILLLPLSIAGCSDDGPTPCAREDCADDLCYHDENYQEVCGCPPGTVETTCKDDSDCERGSSGCAVTYACCRDPNAKEEDDDYGDDCHSAACM
jgi:hypothetical protein